MKRTVLHGEETHHTRQKKLKRKEITITKKIEKKLKQRKKP